MKSVHHHETICLDADVLMVWNGLASTQWAHCSPDDENGWFPASALLHGFMTRLWPLPHHTRHYYKTMMSDPSNLLDGLIVWSSPRPPTPGTTAIPSPTSHERTGGKNWLYYVERVNIINTCWPPRSATTWPLAHAPSWSSRSFILDWYHIKKNLCPKSDWCGYLPTMLVSVCFYLFIEDRNHTGIKCTYGGLSSSFWI